MPGPLGTLGPTVDPNWAWDTPGWTNQGNTQDVEGQNLGAPGQGSMLIEPAALSGYVSRTLDPDVSSVGTGSAFAFATGVANMAALQVLEPVTTSKVVFNIATAAATPTYSCVGLYNAVSGSLVAQTSTTSSNFTGTGGKTLSWATATAISPGYYWVLFLSVAATGVKLNGFTLSPEAQSLLTSTAVMPFVIGSTLRFAVGGTNLTSLAAIPTTLTTAMVVSAAASGYFVGIA
jgi:hypothetical protein